VFRLPISSWEYKWMPCVESSTFISFLSFLSWTLEWSACSAFSWNVYYNVWHSNII
jgi:hypothetical protein